LLPTIQAYLPSFTCGVLAVLCVLRWLWETDRPVEQERVDVGAGIYLPTYVTGPRSHGWWAMIILLVVVGMIFVMALFSFFYLFGVQRQFWTAPAALGSLGLILPAYATAAGLAWFSRLMLAREATERWTPAVLFLLAASALALAIGTDLSAWLASGLRPDQSGQGAT